jgi:hypothetical protein
MNTRTRTRLLLAALWGLAMTGGLLSACSDSTIFIAESSVSSPQGHREAATSAVRQASDTGGGASYTRVTIRDTAPGSQRDVPRVVLCTAGIAAPRIRWIDEGHVQLSYDAGTRLDCPRSQPPGLVVTYRAEPLVAARMTDPR